MLTRRAFLAAAATCLMLSPMAQADYKAEYTVSTVLPDAFPWGQAAEKWVELVKERSQGRINMKIYSNAQLVSGDQTKEFSAMRSGLIDMAVGSTINWSPQVPELNLFSLPFLMPDHEAIDAITQSPAGEAIFQAIEKRGVTPLAWGENGFRELSNSSQAISAPEDLQGLKIRCRRLPPVPGYLLHPGCQPDTDELGRRQTGPDHRRRGWPGKSSVRV